MKNPKSGQVLLITIMLLATALTVVLAISFKSTTETQTTKLQEESQKALAAAEAGIEKALKEGASNTLNLNANDLGQGVSAKVTSSAIADVEHTSRSLNKDEQYTLYLGSAAGDPPDFTNLTPAYSGRLNICFNQGSLEITIMNKNKSITRFGINSKDPDPLDGNDLIPNALTAVKPSTTTLGGTDCPAGTTFTSVYPVDIDGSANGGILLLARVITRNGSLSTPLGFKVPIGSGDLVLPIQGKTLVSTATTQTGATKIVKLFQSYPQIPTDFFVTSF